MPCPAGPRRYPPAVCLRSVFWPLSGRLNRRGFLLGSLIHVVNSDNGQYSARTALGYLAVFGLLIGALLGAVAAAAVAGRRR